MPTPDGAQNAKLQAHGLAGSTAVIVAADISLPTEQLVRTRLHLLPLAARAIRDGAAALILVGEAVGAPSGRSAHRDEQRQSQDAVA